jgi:hypothetical protein
MIPWIYWDKETNSLNWTLLSPWAPTQDVWCAVIMTELLLLEAFFRH